MVGRLGFFCFQGSCRVYIILRGMGIFKCFLSKFPQRKDFLCVSVLFFIYAPCHARERMTRFFQIYQTFCLAPGNPGLGLSFYMQYARRGGSRRAAYFQSSFLLFPVLSTASRPWPVFPAPVRPGRPVFRPRCARTSGGRVSCPPGVRRRCRRMLSVTPA